MAVAFFVGMWLATSIIFKTPNMKKWKSKSANKCTPATDVNTPSNKPAGTQDITSESECKQLCNKTPGCEGQSFIKNTINGESMYKCKLIT